jgi:hypothetical protein
LVYQLRSAHNPLMECLLPGGGGKQKLCCSARDVELLSMLLPRLLESRYRRGPDSLTEDSKERVLWGIGGYLGVWGGALRVPLRM